MYILVVRHTLTYIYIQYEHFERKFNKKQGNKISTQSSEYHRKNQSEGIQTLLLR